jgi:hypothetical protein
VIALTGQFAAHDPHEMQLSASITYCPSPAEIAPTGQLPSHVPQEIQESLITNAMILSSLITFKY